MTLEYILLFSIFVLMLFGAFWNGPRESFIKSGPRLGTRVEKNLVTGGAFAPHGARIRWEADTTGN